MKRAQTTFAADTIRKLLLMPTGVEVYDVRFDRSRHTVTFYLTGDHELIHQVEDGIEPQEIGFAIQGDKYQQIIDILGGEW